MDTDGIAGTPVSQRHCAGSCGGSGGHRRRTWWRGRFESMSNGRGRRKNAAVINASEKPASAVRGPIGLCSPMVRVVSERTQIPIAREPLFYSNFAEIVPSLGLAALYGEGDSGLVFARIQHGDPYPLA